MRLFIAMNFDGETVRRLLDVQAELRARSVKGNFPRPENLHLTLAFLGETPAAALPAPGKVLNGLEAPLPFSLELSRLGRFVHARKELWWAAPAENGPGLAELRALRAALETALDAAGIDYDRRPFSAHITLGREIRLRAGPPELRGGIAVPLRRISLMESRRVGGRLVYTERAGRDL